MNLRKFLDVNWKTVKLFLSIGDYYIPGAIFYRITEMDFDDYVPKTYISKPLLLHKNYDTFKKHTTRFNLNKVLKRYFGNAAFVEHMVSKKYILKYWKECNNKNIFEEYLRNETSVCFLTKSENRILPRIKGKDNFENALITYKKCKIEIKHFNFDFEKK